MLDFESVREKRISLAELCTGQTVDDLRVLTNEMIDAIQTLIAGCNDEDVVFQPVDPKADDPFSASAEETSVAWTLGHVIVHTTASAEESAFLAAEMARGVQNHGRSRYETPWEGITSIAQCHERVEESRRIRLASLDLWPDRPHLELTYAPWSSVGEINCVARFVLGLFHDNDHLGQIAEIVRQAAAQRMMVSMR
ncbi:MAG: DinB family protein [Caldilinea sp.]|jgi:hypothetical protein